MKLKNKLALVTGIRRVSVWKPPRSFAQRAPRSLWQQLSAASTSCSQMPARAPQLRWKPLPLKRSTTSSRSISSVCC
ncbi:hypothetical protein HDG40_000291 [Paraburkholderia sp. JPY158]|uniref:Uncharacterized protein n=1 Tax=Paraburkholderia atlantica TaxID=2654982 RepID=A0A7W8Q1Q6_PARAM|nr:hypothetical protein [Paraburkholderia atlantica]